MGEYAIYQGRTIKIGTCEDMYYLRATQARLVAPERGSLDPRNPGVQRTIRFRFPWPDEDGIEPGGFDHAERRVGVPDWAIRPPADLKHYSVQFVAQRGYLTSLPCPESSEHLPGVTIARNGFPGPVQMVQQAFRGGELRLICECGGCGAAYNLSWTDAERIVVACRAEGDRAARRDEASRATWWQTVADRIAAGYVVPAEVS